MVHPKKHSKGRSQSSRADLVFPVPRIRRHWRRDFYGIRVSKTAPVYMAAVLEYLVAEVVEGSADVCNKAKTKRITPRHIQVFVQQDHGELDQLLSRVHLQNGGVIPSIHAHLLPKKRVRRAKDSDNE